VKKLLSAVAVKASPGYERCFPNVQLVQSCKLGRAFRVGFGLMFVNMFRADFGPAYKLFLQHSKYRFLHSWRRFVLLTTMTAVSEVIVTFLQVILSANTAALFRSLLGLVSNSFWEADGVEEISTRWRCYEKTNHLRDGLQLTGFSTNWSFMSKALS